MVDKQTLLLEMARTALGSHHMERLLTPEVCPYHEGRELHEHTIYIIGRLKEQIAAQQKEESSKQHLA